MRTDIPVGAQGEHFRIFQGQIFPGEGVGERGLLGHMCYLSIST
jgi:hypothetical protein